MRIRKVSVVSVSLQPIHMIQHLLREVGTYADEIVASSATGSASGFIPSNYNITYTSGDLAINRTALSITADDKSKVYGEAEPVRTVTYKRLQKRRG